MRDQVLQMAKRAGVRKIIAVGTDLESSKKAIEVSKEYPEVFASVGIHPHHVYKYCHSEWSEAYIFFANAQDDINEMVKLLSNPKTVAVGETGIDKYRYKITKYSNYSVSKQFIKLQKDIFKLQIKLAIKYNKALIIHNREAVEETLEVLGGNWDKKLSGKSVFHFCEPDIRLLDFAKSHRIFIGVDGDVLTDKTKQEFIKKVPLSLLVLETDSPFIPPPLSLRGAKRRGNLDSGQARMTNTPENLKIILEFISKLLKIDKEKLEQITFENSVKLFNF